MNHSKFIHMVLIVLFIVGIIGAGGLVLEELQTGNGCPKLGPVPACALVLICFLVPFVTHLRNKWNSLYFLFTGLAWLIAIVASILQFTGNAECPKMADGIPMCYLSFLIFSTLIVLKYILIKNPINPIEQNL